MTPWVFTKVAQIEKQIGAKTTLKQISFFDINEQKSMFLYLEL